jgi:hypothetical protein
MSSLKAGEIVVGTNNLLLGQARMEDQERSRRCSSPLQAKSEYCKSPRKYESPASREQARLKREKEARDKYYADIKKLGY